VVLLLHVINVRADILPVIGRSPCADRPAGIRRNAGRVVGVGGWRPCATASLAAIRSDQPAARIALQEREQDRTPPKEAHGGNAAQGLGQGFHQHINSLMNLSAESMVRGRRLAFFSDSLRGLRKDLTSLTTSIKDLHRMMVRPITSTVSGWTPFEPTCANSPGGWMCTTRSSAKFAFGFELLSNRMHQEA